MVNIKEICQVFHYGELKPPDEPFKYSAHAWPDWKEHVYIIVWFACAHAACFLTQVTKQLHSQRCKDKEEKHEEKTEIPHLQRDNRMREGYKSESSSHTKKG